MSYQRFTIDSDNSSVVGQELYQNVLSTEQSSQYYKYRQQAHTLETPNGVAISFFSDNNFNFIKNEVHNMLRWTMGVNLIIPDEQIINVMNNIFNNSTVLDVLNEKTISFITSHVRSEMMMENLNNKFNIEVKKYTPDSTLSRHAPIKLRERRYQPFSVMRY